MADNQDRTIALLGVAATKRHVDLTCPPENTMSAFIEGRIDAKTRAMMLSHINSCEDCYLTWESSSIFLIQQSSKAVSQRQDSEKIGLFQRLGDWFNSGVSWQTAVSGMALASLAIALVVNMPQSLFKSVDSDPTAIVAAITIDNNTLSQSINQLPVPWIDQTFGFNSQDYSEPVKAIGAGLWQVRNALLDLNEPLPNRLSSKGVVDWRESQYGEYFAFGQWALDAWVLASVKDVEPGQWRQLSDSLQALKTSFKQRQEAEATAVLQTIDKMTPALKQLSMTVDFLARRELSREIKMGLQKLFL